MKGEGAVTALKADTHSGKKVGVVFGAGQLDDSSMPSGGSAAFERVEVTNHEVRRKARRKARGITSVSRDEEVALPYIRYLKAHGRGTDYMACGCTHRKLSSLQAVAAAEPLTRARSPSSQGEPYRFKISSTLATFPCIISV